MLTWAQKHFRAIRNTDLAFTVTLRIIIVLDAHSRVVGGCVVKACVGNRRNARADSKVGLMIKGI